jgi:hypothetical protein
MESYHSAEDYCANLDFTEFTVHQYYDEAKDFLGAQHNSNGLKKVMDGDDDYSWDDYARDTALIVVPWAALAVLAMLIWLVPGSIRRCCKVKSEPSVRVKVGLLIATGVMLSGAMVFASVNLKFLDDAYEGYQQAQCAAYRVPYDVVYGSSYNKTTWGGLDYCIDLLQEIIVLLDSEYTPASEIAFANTTWLELQPEETYAEIFRYYWVYKNLTVESPDPTQPGSSISTEYTYDLGPPNQLLTYTGSIYEEVRTKLGPLIFLLKEIKETSLTSLYFMGYINNTLSATETALIDLRQDMDKLHNNIVTWLIDHRSQAKATWLFLSFSSLLIVAMGLTIVMSLAMVVQFRVKKLTASLYSSWYIAGLASIIGLVLMAYMVGISVVMYDYCELGEDVTTTEGLSKYDNLVPSTAVRYLNVCFNGDGNLAKYLHIDEYLVFVNLLLKFYTQLSKLDIDRDYLTDLVSLAYNQDKIASSLAFLNVSASALATQTLAELNSWSDYSVEDSYQKAECKNKTATFDNWVEQVEYCKAGYQLVNATLPQDLLGEECCLVVDQWDDLQTLTRYSDLDCRQLSSEFRTVAATIAAYRGQYSNYMASVTSLFSAIELSFTGLAFKIETLANNTASLAESVEEFYVSINQTLTLISSETDGLENVLNCSFLKQIRDQLKIGACENLMPSTFAFTVGLGLTSLLLLGTSSVSYALARLVSTASWGEAL